LKKSPIFASLAVALALTLVAGKSACEAQSIDVSARVDITQQGKHDAHPRTSNVVVWLTPLQDGIAARVPTKPQEFTLAQKDKQFKPHLLVVPTGSSVNFPNLDPYFHNVFSLFNGKRFDLGLYQGHSHHAVQFDREGISFIFCNIHPDMGAVVVSLSTPYYAISSPDGSILIRSVPPGKYKLSVWAENVSADSLNKMTRDIEINSQNSQLGTLKLLANEDIIHGHLNKYGEPYEPATTTPY